MDNRFGAWGRGGMRGPDVSPVIPTSMYSENYIPFADTAPDGGGVLPSSQGPNPEWGIPAGNPGGGGQSSNDPSAGTGSRGVGPGGFDAGTGNHYYEDGGLVPDDESDGMEGQGAESSTLDPMAVVKKALRYGRQKMGVPANFTQGPESEQAFDDGGEVGDQGDGGVIPQDGGVTADGNTGAQQGGPQMPDPRAALSYLTGAGNISPDIASALERRIDPQGTMNPSLRTTHTIASAPSPDAAFGLMQHYRTKYNAYAGGARAAFDQGNLGQAAAHATQAFQNIPTGADVRFAPARGGIAMSVKNPAMKGRRPNGGPKEQGFDEGGEVDELDTGPDEGVIQEPVSAFAETEQDQPTILTPEQFKEVVSAGYDKPLDEGISGFLKSILQGAKKQLAQDPITGGLWNDEPPDQGPQQPRATSFRKGSILDKMFGTGGAPDVAAAMAPEQPQEQGTPGRWQPTPSIMDAARNQPGQRTGLQESTVGKTNRMDTQQRAGAPAPPTSGMPRSEGARVERTFQGSTPPIGPTPRSGGTPKYNPFIRGLEKAGPNGDPLAAFNQRDWAKAGGYVPPGWTPENAGPRWVNAAAKSEGQTWRPYGNARVQQAEPTSMDTLQKKYQTLASRLFPGSSQGGQRAAYITHMIDKDLEGQGKIELEHSKGRQVLQAQREQFQHNENAAKLLSVEKRNENTNNTRRDLGTGKEEHADTRTMANLIGRAANTIRTNNSSIKPDALMKELSKQFGLPVPDIQRYLQIGKPQGAANTAPPSNTSSSKVGDTQPYTVNGVTKNYIFKSDGQWHLQR